MCLVAAILDTASGYTDIHSVCVWEELDQWLPMDISLLCRREELDF